MDDDAAPVRVVIADDDPLARRALRDALQERGFHVIADAADGRDAVELAVHYKPDVVLMDIVMPSLDGVEATAQLRARCPEVHVLLLTRSADAEMAVAGLRVGAAGFVRKETDLDVLANAVRDTAKGQSVVDPVVVARLVDRLRTAPEAGIGLRPVSSPLTDREWEILDGLCVGLNPDQIADAFVVSVETVRSHVKSIFRKLGVHSQAEAVEVAATLRRPSAPPRQA
jgi:DNA-binding NarL/FixJ family response regulator